MLTSKKLSNLLKVVRSAILMAANAFHLLVGELLYWFSFCISPFCTWAMFLASARCIERFRQGTSEIVTQFMSKNKPGFLQIWRALSLLKQLQQLKKLGQGAKGGQGKDLALCGCYLEHKTNFPLQCVSVNTFCEAHRVAGLLCYSHACSHIATTPGNANGAIAIATTSEEMQSSWEEAKLDL